MKNQPTFASAAVAAAVVATLAAALVTTVIAGVAQANTDASLKVNFVESAPKDRFSITNTSTLQFDSFEWQINLSGTYGKLIFDTTSSGQGVEVFQPFEVREGELKMTSGTRVLDGADSLSVTITNLAPGQTASFTIDVDDTRVNSELGQIRVSRAEISGAVMRISNIKLAGQQQRLQNDYLGSIDNSGSVSVMVKTGN